MPPATAATARAMPAMLEAQGAPARTGRGPAKHDIRRRPRAGAVRAAVPGPPGAGLGP